MVDEFAKGLGEAVPDPPLDIKHGSALGIDGVALAIRSAVPGHHVGGQHTGRMEPAQRAVNRRVTARGQYRHVQHVHEQLSDVHLLSLLHTAHRDVLRNSVPRTVACSAAAERLRTAGPTP
ncbi:hypothetical protein GCM10023166_36600 [Paeniglutamicibacter cryotolerans]